MKILIKRILIGMVVIILFLLAFSPYLDLHNLGWLSNSCAALSAFLLARIIAKAYPEKPIKGFTDKNK